MMAWLILTLACAVIAGGVDPAQPVQAVAPVRQTLTVATFNVQNLLDVFDDPYSLDEKSPVKPAEAIADLAATIRRANADVVALQEVEHEGLLRAVVADQLSDMGYEFIVVEPTNSYFGANLGVISRLPILSITSHRPLDLRLEHEPRRWRFSRDLLCVRIRVTARRTLDLFVTHFKYGDDERSRQWRLAEAIATRKIIHDVISTNPDRWVLLAGDLNDHPASVTLSTLLHRGCVEAPGIENRQEVLSGNDPAASTTGSIGRPPQASSTVPTPASTNVLIDLHTAVEPAQRVTRLTPEVDPPNDHNPRRPTQTEGPIKNRLPTSGDRGESGGESGVESGGGDTVDYLLANAILASRMVKGSAVVATSRDGPSGSDHALLMVTFGLETDP